MLVICYHIGNTACYLQDLPLVVAEGLCFPKIPCFPTHLSRDLWCVTSIRAWRSLTPSKQLRRRQFSRNKTYHFGIVVCKVASGAVVGVWTPWNQPKLSVSVEVNAGGQQRTKTARLVLKNLCFRFGTGRCSTVRFTTRHGAGSGVWREIGKYAEVRGESITFEEKTTFTGFELYKQTSPKYRQIYTIWKPTPEECKLRMQASKYWGNFAR